MKDVTNIVFTEFDGYCTYKDKYTAQQHPNAWKTFEDFLLKEKFDLIIEIGTARGGFTEFLYDFEKENGLGYSLVSFDINDPVNSHIGLMRKGIAIYHINIFDHENKKIDMDKAWPLLSTPGRKLILCDGGNKISEFNILANYLNTDDVIMAHDYAPNWYVFEESYKNQIWNWCEIEDKDIEEISNINSLAPYNYDAFACVAWVCKICKISKNKLI